MWYLGCVSPEFFKAHLLGPRQRRLERLPCRHVFIHALPRIRATQRSVGEIPFASVEAKSLVYEYLPVSTASRRFVLENNLASVPITRPFVKNQHARKILHVDD